MANNTIQLREEMLVHYQNWQQSKLSQIGFCTLHGISFHKFNYWVKKIERGDQKPDKSSGSGFLSVAIKPTARDCKVEIVRSDGTRILFHGPVEAAFVKSLLD
jgi:hypothetical protein